MRTFATYIEYLLMTRHYCYVPGRGAYMLSTNPAGVTVQGPADGSLDSKDSTRVLNAPHRVVRFSPLHTHDDGMLANLLMEAEGMTFDEATRYIARQAPLLPDDFAAVASLHTDTQHFGFDDLNIETWTNIENRLAQVEAANHPNAGTRSHSTDAEVIAIPKYWLRRAAVALLIGGLFFSNFIGLNEPDVHRASVINMGALHTPHSTVNPIIASGDGSWAKMTSSSTSDFSQLADFTKFAVLPEPEAKPTLYAVPSETHYYLVVGSTRSEEQAFDMYSRYEAQGFQGGGILVTPNLYRVYIGSFANKDEALLFLRSVRTQSQKLSKTWLLPFEGNGPLSSYIIKNRYNDNQLSMELSHTHQRTERDQG